jgi:hypothetical protein
MEPPSLIPLAQPGDLCVPLLAAFGGAAGVVPRLRAVENFHHRRALEIWLCKIEVPVSWLGTFDADEVWAELEETSRAGVEDAVALLDKEMPGSGAATLARIAAEDERRVRRRMLALAKRGGDGGGAAAEPAREAAPPPAAPARTPIENVGREELVKGGVPLTVVGVTFLLVISDLRALYADAWKIVDCTRLSPGTVAELWKTRKGVEELISGARQIVGRTLSVLLQCEALWTLVLMRDRPIDAVHYKRALHIVDKYMRKSWGDIEDGVRATFLHEFYAYWDADGEAQVRRVIPKFPMLVL